MSNTVYYLAWLAAGLVAIAVASAAIAQRVRVLRRVQAALLLEALASYTDWIAVRRHAAYFQGDAHEDDSPLQEVRAIQREWFPELSDEAARLFEVHAHLIDHLWTQQVLRLKDAEAWLESDPDAGVMPLWRSHRDAARAVAEKLDAITGAGEPGMKAESSFFA